MNVRSQVVRSIRRLAAVVAAASIVFGATGCSANDGLADQFKAGDNKNYIAGDGSVTEFAKGSRQAPEAWGGVTESGSQLESSSLVGIPVVLNFWYAGCAPCRAEAPDLRDLQTEFRPERVQFVGVNVRDTAATALAFDRNFKMNFPSIIEVNSGRVLLAFTGVVTPQAVPTTLVLDREGKVSARILGRIDKSTLKALIKTVVLEK